MSTTPGGGGGGVGGTTTGEVLGTTTSSSGGGVSPGSTPTSGTKAAKHTLGSTAPLRAARQSGTLPFTGAQLTIFALVGVALIVGGYLLHTTGRRRRSDA